MAYLVAPVIGGVGAQPDPARAAGQTSRSAGIMAARAALREATHEIHERLHRHKGLADLATGTITTDDYRRLLARNHGFYAMAQATLGMATVLTDALAADLGELGLCPRAIADLPRCAPVAVAGDAEAIGGRYVLIGAALGGKMMARALAGRTNHGAALPVHFLLASSHQDWPGFTAGLERDLPDAAARTRAASAAAAWFAAYEEWMA